MSFNWQINTASLVMFLALCDSYNYFCDLAIHIHILIKRKRNFYVLLFILSNDSPALDAVGRLFYMPSLNNKFPSSSKYPVKDDSDRPLKLDCGVAVPTAERFKSGFS